MPAVYAFQRPVMYRLYAQLHPDFNMFVELDEKIVGLRRQAIRAGSDTHRGKVERVQQFQIHWLLAFSKGGGEGLNIRHVFFSTIAIACKPDRLGHLLLHGRCTDRLYCGRAAHIAECTAARAIKFAVGAAEVKVDWNTEKRFAMALDQVVFILKIGVVH